jgi:hypothetical protein
MLPASLQIPAGLVLVVSGALACFVGYRLFRVVLTIYGFILGAAVASSIMGPADRVPMIVAALVGGFIGAGILNLAYFVGVALIGAAAGVFVLHALWPRFGTGDPHVFLVVLCAVAGAVAAASLQRWVIIVATAFGGAWTAIIGASALLGNRAAKVAAATSDVWVFYPFNLEPGRRWLLLVWLVVSVIGIAVQAAGKTKVRVRQVKRKTD